ncbi:hypothetical protein LSAT2_026919 [Lamellibrachia satsuma]|nr:hypothetical protein LSAT2_026919 [Lamellibrachia satsuma]
MFGKCIILRCSLKYKDWPGKTTNQKGSQQGHCGSKVQGDMAFRRHGLLLLSAICVAVTYASDVDDKAIAKAKIESCGG